LQIVDKPWDNCLQKWFVSIHSVYVCVEDDEVNIGAIYTCKHFWAGHRMLYVFSLDHPRTDAGHAQLSSGEGLNMAHIPLHII